MELVFESWDGAADGLYLPMLQGHFDYIVLDSQDNEQIFNTFISSWLNYRHEGNPVDEVFIQKMADNELALSGGLRLMMGDRVIMPSCCAEFGDFREWVSICQGAQPSLWLGHTPMPVVEYQDDMIIVTSNGDTEPPDEVFELRFARHEFIRAFDKIWGDVAVLCQFRQAWAQRHLPHALQHPFVQNFYRYMNSGSIFD